MVDRGRVVSVTAYHLGLGNRLRAVLGARALARLEGRSFSYSWPTGRTFGARLDQLWQFPEKRISTARVRLLRIRYPYRDSSLRWLDDETRNARTWLIKTGHALELPGSVSWEHELRELEPHRDVADRARSFHDARLAGEPYVGVMIRAHAVSHAKTREHSPLSWYVGRMRAIRRVRPNVPFFVSCDVADVASAITAEFPRSFTLTDKGKYNSAAGLRAAVVDLYLLASSAYLLGPHYSSFPEMAQILGGSSLILETSQSHPEAPPLPDQLAHADDPTRPWQRA